MPGDERESLAKDLEATVAARAELGPEYEPALVESFLERIDAQIERKVDAELKRPESSDRGYPEALAYVSLGTGVPITAIAGGTAQLWGIVAAWSGIVGVNAAAAWGSRRRRR